MSTKAYATASLHRRGLVARVPFYWRNALWLQRVLGSPAQQSSHVVLAVVALCLVVIGLNSGLWWFLFALAPLVLWSIPLLALIILLRLRYQTVRYDNDMLIYISTRWQTMSAEKKKELKPVAKAVLGEVKHPLSQSLYTLVQAYKDAVPVVEKSDLKVQAIVESALDTLERERLGRQRMKEEGWG